MVATCLAMLLVVAGCGETGTTGTASDYSTKGEDGEIVMSAVRNNNKVDVTVRLNKNCGINAMALTLKYDTDALTLTGLDQGSALKSLNLITTNTATEKGYAITPFKFDYLNANKNDTSTGVMFTLHFSIKKGSGKKSTTVDLTYDSGSIKSLSDGSTTTRAFAVKPAIIAL